MSRDDADHEDIAHHAHADDVASIFTDLCADVEVAKVGQIRNIQPAYFITARAGMVIHDVVVNHHVKRLACRTVQVVVLFDIEGLSACGDVDELESITASDPQEVRADVGHETRHVVVTGVEHT